MEPQAPGGGEVKLEQLDDLNLDIDNINDLVVEAVLGEAFGMRKIFIISHAGGFSGADRRVLRVGMGPGGTKFEVDSQVV